MWTERKRMRDEIVRVVRVTKRAILERETGGKKAKGSNREVRWAGQSR